MAYPQTAPGQVLDIPVGGMNTKDSLTRMDASFSPLMLNVDTDGQKITSRKGFDLFGTIDDDSEVVLALGVAGDPSSTTSSLYAYCQGGDDGNNKLQLANGDGTFSVPTSGVFGTGQADEVVPFNYKTYLGFNVEAGVANEAAKVSSAGVISLMGFTYSGNAFSATASCEYKGRVYHWNGATLYYSSLGAITGACDSVSLTDFFKYSSYRGPLLTVLSSPGERASETYLVVGNLAGEILVYAGDYPASATWNLVGKYKIPPLMDFRAYIEIDNDVWILTSSGIVSLRNLMNSGERALNELSPTWNIQRYWTELMSVVPSRLSGSTNVSAAYWPEQNKLYVFVPARNADPTASATTTYGSILVYDMASKAWTIHLIPDTIMLKTQNVAHLTHGGIVYFQNNVYFHIGPNVYRYKSTYDGDDKDPTRGTTITPIEGDIYSSYNALGDMQARKEVQGWAPLFKSEGMSGLLEFSTSIDVERQITAASKPAFPDGVNSLTVLNGGVGTLFQWRLHFETDDSTSYPLELYSMGVII